MKNVENVDYLLVDHKIKRMFAKRGVILMPSLESYKKFRWTRKYFEKEPKEGYFIWVKNQIDFPLSTCITIASPNVSQSLMNLVVIEKNIKVKMNGVCNAIKEDLCGKHIGYSKIFLKENSVLEINHLHKWGKKDFVNSNIEFYLGKNSKLSYMYKNLFPPKKLKMRNLINTSKNSSANIEIMVNGIDSEIDLSDTLLLEGKNASGVVRLRLVGRKNSDINAYSTIIAEVPGKGHLDCQGLLIDKDSRIRLVPELLDKNNKALITHEASIGRVSEEELNYLRSRGLTEKEAIDLIVSGFLKL